MMAAMDIVLNRRAGVSVRDQLVAQIEMNILGGALGPGQRMPSVRALARRLSVHPNTVSAAYQELQDAGYVERRQGSGVFLCAETAHSLEDARGLDEMIRMALQAAFSRGFNGAEIRTAVERWLAAAPPDRVLVVDVEKALAELMAAEIGPLVPLPTYSTTIAALEDSPEPASGALVVCSRHHLVELRRLLPGLPVEPVSLATPKIVSDGLRRLPSGALFVAVSHSPAVLEMASVIARSLRGDEISVEMRVLGKAREWRPLAKVADLVFADALSFPSVRPVHARRVQEFRVVVLETVERLRDSLAIVVPRRTAFLEKIAAGGARRR
jgi:GntR family transcriptional regulator